MTGYATVSFDLKNQKFSLEIKSYNHKYLDIVVKVPKVYSYLENQVRKAIGKYVTRGRVEFSLYIEELNLERYINVDKAKLVYKQIKDLSKELGIKEDITLEHILTYKELLFPNNDRLILLKVDEKIFWDNFAKLIESFTKSRIKEGREIQNDIKKRLKVLEKSITKIEKLVPLIKENNILRIKKRLSEIFDKEESNLKLEQEIVYYTDKMDVSEEITRFKTHLKNIKDILQSKEQIGKKLDFYTQELLREINTLTVKSQDAQVSKISVDIKSEIEKIREQAQNVE